MFLINEFYLDNDIKLLMLFKIQLLMDKEKLISYKWSIIKIFQKQQN